MAQGEIIGRLCYERDESMAHLTDIPFYDRQTKRVLANVGRIDPQRIVLFGYNVLNSR